MNVKLLLGLTGLLEVFRIGLSQAQTDPEQGFWDLARDFPILAIFLVSIYFILKWVVKILEDQRTGLREIYESNQDYLSDLLRQIEAKQNKLETKIEKLTGEVEMFRATLGEAVNVKDVVDQLLEKIEAKR